MEMISFLRNLGVVPVIKITDASKAAGLANALVKGGLPAAEVTFRSDAAEASLKAMSVACPDLFLCAGTILTVEQAKRAVGAGAKAIISPGIGPAVVEWCLKEDIPVIPGCATPTEVQVCLGYGLDLVKLFPAEVVGGVKMLKALSGPYGALQFMPTGGVTAATLKDYLALPNVAACGGTWIVPADALDSGDFARIETLTREAAAIRGTI